MENIKNIESIESTENKKSFLAKFSDPVILIVLILIATYILTFFIPAGEYLRKVVDGQTVVIANSFHTLTNISHLNPFDVFVAIPKGLVNAGQYLFIVFIAGGLFHIIQKTHSLENAIGVFVKTLGVKRKNTIITIITFIYGFFGIAVGFENNIALIPVALLISSSVGLSPLVGACISVGGIGLGFALSPINPYTVGVAQGIAELPLFSGWALRLALVTTALAVLSLYICKYVAYIEYETKEGTKELRKELHKYSLNLKDKLILLVFTLGLVIMTVGAFSYNWYINEIAGLFLLMAIIIGYIHGFSSEQIVKEMMDGAAAVVPGALIIGIAASVQVVLNQAHIIDTIVHGLSYFISSLPLAVSSVMSSIVQGIINLFIPGGSGQAMVTMPILIPLADLTGMSRQLMITSFQIGDGLTNLVVPTSGGTLAMLALSGVSYSKWLKVITPLMIFVYVICWVGLILGGMFNY